MLQKSLIYDRKTRVENVAAKATHFLETNNTHEAYLYLQGWYKPARTKPTNSTEEEINKLKQEYIDLYTAIAPREPPTPTFVKYDKKQKYTR
jgi:hypothetical protein